jgi:endonuclease/exonuclease/phosphatase family metal-dependent hydrolase
MDKGDFNFENSYNNTIYADILVKEDTIRLYNLHLQSLGILPNVKFLQNRGTEKITKRIAKTFVEQEKQVALILEHRNTSKHPVITAGDFNNTPFSYTYRQLQNGMKDAFLERGNGLGTSYSFSGYPMRIDYLFSSETLDILRFETGDKSFSDHRPVSATFAW